MKLSFFPTALFLLCLSACVSDDQNDFIDPQPSVVNNWRLAEGKPFLKTDKDIRTIYRQYFDSMNEPISDEQLDSLELSFQVPSLDLSQMGQLFEFRSDGTIVTDEQVQGIWRTEGDEDRTIYIKGVSNDVPGIYFKIVTLTNEEFKLEARTDDLLDLRGLRQSILDFRIGPDELLFDYQYVFTASQ